MVTPDADSLRLSVRNLQLPSRTPSLSLIYDFGSSCATTPQYAESETSFSRTAYHGSEVDRLSIDAECSSGSGHQL